MPFVALDGCHLYYELHGPTLGTAPVLIFAHGAGGNHLSWWQQIPHFAPQFSCVTFDHRSFGQSLNTDDSAPGLRFADDLRGLMDHVDIPQATIVAQSMGGWTALGCALQFPERVERLILCNTHGGLYSDELAALWRASLAEMNTLPPGVHPAAGERMLREQPALHFLYLQIAALNSPASAAVGPWLVTTGHTPLARASEVRIPVLIVAGEEDRVIPVSMLKIAADAFPMGQIAFVPRAGHSAYFERADAVNRLIERFLAPST